MPHRAGIEPLTCRELGIRHLPRRPARVQQSLASFATPAAFFSFWLFFIQR